MSEDMTALEEKNLSSGEEKVLKEHEILAKIGHQELMLVHIASENFLVLVKDCEKVVRLHSLTAVPMAPSHLLGVCNIHGLVVCIVDPIKVLNLQGTLSGDEERTRFVIYRHPRMKVGLQVDAVSRVFQVREDQLPSSDTEELIQGKVEVAGDVYSLLNLKALLQ